ncbi:IPT/TIG domain-containing protein [Natranaerofaba carboxydovora]|uniref:IPT/TIG domain-containing protein n=1 Tax=Natranaerofaba carboxydovora TaxID=2742683 RepID=UPI001F138DC4|nr:IPT/TIG domain-containing protein [Natranaerofaba carboxydovora]UMZ72518.1 IPT/TIG domain protein [Natranaerofaba carboxydovora]
MLWQRSRKKILMAAGLMVIFFTLLAIIILPGFGDRTRIDEIYPLEGPVGTTVTVTGRNFGDSPESNIVLFGDTEARTLSWSDTKIRAKVPRDAQSGLVTVIKDEEHISGETFNILAVEVEPLGEKAIIPTDDYQELLQEEIGVFLPSGFTEEELHLKIGRVANAPGYDEEMYAKTPVYQITMGEKRQFDDHIMIRLPLDEEMAGNGPVRLTYWNEDTLEWTPLPTEVDEEEGFVYGYTDHLSLFRTTYMIRGYWFVASNHFMVGVDPNDAIDLKDGSMDSLQDLARETGKLLDQQYLRYKDELGEDYSPDYFYGERSWWDRATGGKTDTRPIVWLLSNYNEDGAEYSWKTRRIYLPTQYTHYEELATTIGHELFHAFQHDGRNRSKRLTIAEMAGERRWLMEATAEYAAHYVATDIGLDKLHRHARPYYHLEYFSNRGQGHEYAMAAFIHFLVIEKGADFGAMWREIVDNRPMLQKAFQDYTLRVSGGITVTLYREFWHHVLTNSNMPDVDHMRDLSAPMALIPADDENLSVNRSMRIRRDYSMDLLWFNPVTLNYDDDGKALINIEPANQIPEGVRIDAFKLSDFAYYTDDDGNPFTTYKRVQGGKEPHGSMFDDTVREAARMEGSPYLQFEMDEEADEILVITAYGSRGGSSFDIKISQMVLGLAPHELTEVDPEEEYEFTATIKNVPGGISDITFRWKLENGETISVEEYSNDKDQISDTIEFSFEYTMGPTEKQNLEVEVLNSQTGEVIKTGTVILEEDPEVIILGDRKYQIPLRSAGDEDEESFEYEHNFEAIVEPGDGEVYLFDWDFDDGNVYQERGENSRYTHTYRDITEEDVFNPKVSITPVKEGKLARETVSEDSIRIEFSTEPEGLEGDFSGYLVIEEADKIREYAIDLFTPFGVIIARAFGSDISREEVRDIVADSIEETGINRQIGLSINIELQEDGNYLVRGYIQGEEGWVEYSNIGVYENEVLSFNLDDEDGSTLKMEGRLIDENHIEGTLSIDAWSFWGLWSFLDNAASGSWWVERE